MENQEAARRLSGVSSFLFSPMEVILVPGTLTICERIGLWYDIMEAGN
jgi:hypothetical protein